MTDGISPLVFMSKRDQKPPLIRIIIVFLLLAAIIYQVHTKDQKTKSTLEVPVQEQFAE